MDSAEDGKSHRTADPVPQPLYIIILLSSYIIFWNIMITGLY